MLMLNSPKRLLYPSILGDEKALEFTCALDSFLYLPYLRPNRAVFPTDTLIFSTYTEANNAALMCAEDMKISANPKINSFSSEEFILGIQENVDIDLQFCLDAIFEEFLRALPFSSSLLLLYGPTDSSFDNYPDELKFCLTSCLFFLSTMIFSLLFSRYSEKSEENMENLVSFFNIFSHGYTLAGDLNGLFYVTSWGVEDLDKVVKGDM